MIAILILIGGAFLIYCFAKLNSFDTSEIEEKLEKEYEEIYEPTYNKSKVYYTDNHFRAYELTQKGMEQIDTLMQDIARHFPGELFTTKSRLRSFNLVGAQHHGTEAWILFFGKCKPESNNPYDKNAVSLYTPVGKLMGYLSREDAMKYREYFGEAPSWCWGYTYETKRQNVAGHLTCLGELFDTPKGQKTPVLDIIRGGLISDCGELGFSKELQKNRWEE